MINVGNERNRTVEVSLMFWATLSIHGKTSYRTVTVRFDMDNYYAVKYKLEGDEETRERCNCDKRRKRKEQVSIGRFTVVSAVFPCQFLSPKALTLLQCNVSLKKSKFSLCMYLMFFLVYFSLCVFV